MLLDKTYIDVFSENVFCFAQEACPSTTVDCYCPSVGVCEYSNFSVSLNSLIVNNTHTGKHHRDYFFDIEVLNNALLLETKRVDMFVDASPPKPGVVFEGPTGSKDNDYTGSANIMINWQGFIDHESDILFYHIGVTHSCMTADNISLSIIFKELDAPETDISITLPVEGKYFTTIIAYNKAVTASVPVCSDGIVFNSSPATVFNVTLQNAKIPESFACNEDGIWIIGPRAIKRKVNITSNFKCRINCASANTKNSMLSLLPEGNKISEMEECNHLLDLNNVYTYLPNADIHLTWNISENESQVSQVFVGFGTNPSTMSTPDIISYFELKQHTFFKNHHSGMGNDYKFYIFIKAINKASIESIAAFGPVVVIESKPLCNGKPSVSVDKENITIVWDTSIFADPDQMLDIGIIYHRFGECKLVLLYYCLKCTCVSYTIYSTCI